MSRGVSGAQKVMCGAESTGEEEGTKETVFLPEMVEEEAKETVLEVASEEVVPPLEVRKEVLALLCFEESGFRGTRTGESEAVEDVETGEEAGRRFAVSNILAKKLEMAMMNAVMNAGLKLA